MFQKYDRKYQLTQRAYQVRLTKKLTEIAIRKAEDKITRVNMT